jgi:hypothetical protein
LVALIDDQLTMVPADELVAQLQMTVACSADDKLRPGESELRSFDNESFILHFIQTLESDFHHHNSPCSM